MTIAKIVEFAEEVVDVVSDLVPLSKGQRKQLNKAITSTSKARTKIKNWSRGASPSAPSGAMVTHPQITMGQMAGVANSVNVARSKPRMVASSGNVRIAHRELVGVIHSENGALTTSPVDGYQRSLLTMSPTNNVLFPWLSTIAEQYDYFKFNRVRLEYVPLCATSQTGRVMLAYEPDAKDEVSRSRVGLSSYFNSVDGSAWGVLSLDLKLINNVPWYSCQGPSFEPTNTNTQGAALWATWAGSTADIGELYITYDVSLKDPQPKNTDVLQATGTAAVVSTIPSSGLVGFSATANSITVTFKAPGTYVVALEATATAVGNPVMNGGVKLGQSYVASGATSAVQALVVADGGTSYSTAYASNTLSSYLVCGTLTGLAAWRVTVIPIGTCPYVPAYP